MKRELSVSFRTPLLIVVITLIMAGCIQRPLANKIIPRIALEPLAAQFEQPLLVTSTDAHPEAIFVVEKAGRIRVIVDGEAVDQPVLDLRNDVSRGFEQGLLGLAFHPHFEENRLFFINYTDTRGDTRIVRYKMADSEFVADSSSRQQIMQIEQPAANHNGGMLSFGPDGYLYIGMGDGGGGGDPFENGQNPATLLGKMLRVDVDGPEPYGIPATNPFIDSPGYRHEIWATGLRNPWRFSFDRLTGDLYIADVGQNAWEEVNFQPASSPGGENYGWNRLEGTHCYPAQSTCVREGTTLPAIQYSHSATNGCSITGGYVYRGTAIPSLVGQYIFADYCSGRIWVASPQDTTSLWPMSSIMDSGMQVSSFGEDSQGELYITDLSGGRVYKIIPANDE